MAEVQLTVDVSPALLELLSMQMTVDAAAALVDLRKLQETPLPTRRQREEMLRRAVVLLETIIDGRRKAC